MLRVVSSNKHSPDGADDSEAGPIVDHALLPRAYDRCGRIAAAHAGWPETARSPRRTGGRARWRGGRRRDLLLLLADGQPPTARERGWSDASALRQLRHGAPSQGQGAIATTPAPTVRTSFETR